MNLAIKWLPHSAILLHLCLSWPSSETFPPALYGNKYRDPQLDNMQKVKDFRSLSFKRDVFIKSFPLGLRTLWKKRNQGLLDSAGLAHIWTPEDRDNMHKSRMGLQQDSKAERGSRHRLPPQTQKLSPIDRPFANGKLVRLPWRNMLLLRPDYMSISRCPTSNKLNSIFEVPSLIILSWGIFVNLQIVVYLYWLLFLCLYGISLCVNVSLPIYVSYSFCLVLFSCLLAFPAYVFIKMVCMLTTVMYPTWARHLCLTGTLIQQCLRNVSDYFLWNLTG